MENYEKISLTFKKLLNRTKIMRDRLNEIKNTMDKNTSLSFIKSEQYSEIKLESECIASAVGYLNTDLKRTIIMLKISLYKQEDEKDISKTEPNIMSPINTNNDLVEINKEEKESGALLENTDNTKQECIDQSPKLTKKATTEFTDNEEMHRKKIGQEFTYEDADFDGRKKSIRSNISSEIAHVLIFFFPLKTLYKLLASRKVKCKMRSILLFFSFCHDNNNKNKHLESLSAMTIDKK